jgi:hypothetical protein
MVLDAIILGSLILEACTTARDTLIPSVSVGGGDTGPRSADTNTPIGPMLINDNFVGATEIKKACEQKMGGPCEVFGVAFPDKEKIHPFVEHEGVNYVWGGAGRFERLTPKQKDGKIVWTNSENDIYFVGVPEDGSTTDLKELYYVDPSGRVWNIIKPWGKLLASAVKLTETPTTSPTWTPTFAPTLTPMPPTIGVTVVKPTATQIVTQMPVETRKPLPTEIPKPTAAKAELPVDWPEWIRQHPEFGWTKIDDNGGGHWVTKTLSIDVCGNVQVPHRSIKDWPYDATKPEFERGKTYVTCVANKNGFTAAFEYRIK